jgi:nucleotide-binding universal stress UspA family protein
MSGILCPIRAGKVSRSTIEAAVTLANQKEAKLTFLIVVDSNVFTNVDPKRLPTLKKEMAELGKMILHGAKNMAASQGILSEGLIREGQVEEEILAVGQDIQADYIVVGQPRKQANNNLFSQDRLAHLSSRVEQETPAKVVLV